LLLLDGYFFGPADTSTFKVVSNPVTGFVPSASSVNGSLGSGTSHVDIQKIKCVNSNINVNGIDITEIPQDANALAAANEGGAGDAANTQNGNGLADRINFERNLVNICLNVNVNDQIKVSPPEEPGPPPVEICDNQIDDDGDGDTDCGDSECRLDPFCF
jgi:hypothetical protein